MPRDRFLEHEVPCNVPQALFLLGAMPFGFQADTNDAGGLCPARWRLRGSCRGSRFQFLQNHFPCFQAALRLFGCHLFAMHSAVESFGKNHDAVQHFSGDQLTKV